MDTGRTANAETARAATILDRMKQDSITARQQALDNLTCFVHPSSVSSRLDALASRLRRDFENLTPLERPRVMVTLSWVAVSYSGSYELKLSLQDDARHGGGILSDEEAQNEAEKLLGVLAELEGKDSHAAREALQAERTRLMKIAATRGDGLLGVKARDADADSFRGWVNYWARFGKESNMRKLREAMKGPLGVDYGLGVLESRILWGADLVMMNPTLARMAIAEDEELARMARALSARYCGELTRECLVREATKIAGLKARAAMRAPFLLKGRGKVSFQVNPRTYNEPAKLEGDIRDLHREFSKEAAEYDEGLFLEEVLTPEEIKTRKGLPNAVYKVDGSSRNVYGRIDELMLRQARTGAIRLAEGDSGGVMERVMADGINCNVTVAGFVTDGLWSFFCQIRGHARARARGLPITHSLITKMGGRVEASLRWVALKHLAEKLGTREAEELAKLNPAANGTLDQPRIRELARKAGFIPAGDIEPRNYPGASGKIFPTDAAMTTIAEAITKRSHRIMNALEKCRALKDQDLEEWETGDLQASMRGPYGGRYPHVEALVGMFAQGHFPDATLAIERWSSFRANPDAVSSPPDPDRVSELYHSVIGKEWAAAYEVEGTLKEILSFLKVYEESYGERGIKIDELAQHPFSHQTLFGKVLGSIPQSDEEKDKVRAGFVGDFNLLGEEMLRGA